MELYKRIKDRREFLDISQAELAEAMGYTSRSTIAKIESGKNDLAQSKIPQMAEALRTTPAYLMGWTDDPYDYASDPDHIYAKIPDGVRAYLEKLTRGDRGATYNIWSTIRHSKSAKHAAQNVTSLTPEQVEIAFNADWDASIDDFLGITPEEIVYNNPEFQHLLKYFYRLNEQGQERLQRYAEDLSGNPLYQKK